MAIGDISTKGKLTHIELLASATATNSPPSGATAGIDLQDVESELGDIPHAGVISVASTAGSGTMTVTCKLWGYLAGVANWCTVGNGSNAGVLNAGSAIAEVAADRIGHSEYFEGLGAYDRLYLEITAIGGTATAVTGRLHFYNGGV